MKRIRQAVVATLVLTAVTAQPVTAFATPAPTTAATADPLPAFYLAGVFICTGLTWGKMEVEAGSPVLPPGERLRGFLRCAFPPLGLAKLLGGQ